MIVLILLFVCLSMTSVMTVTEYTQKDLSDCLPSYRPGYCLHTLKNPDIAINVTSNIHKSIDPAAELLDINKINETQFFYAVKKAYFRDIRKFRVSVDANAPFPYSKKLIRDTTKLKNLVFNIEEQKFSSASVDEFVNVFFERPLRGKFVCPKGYFIYHNGSHTTCFKSYGSRDGYTFQECLDKCKENNGQAGVFDSEAEALFLQSNTEVKHSGLTDYGSDILRVYGFWTGTRLPSHKKTQYKPEDAYNMDGSSSNYIPFANGEPNAGGPNNSEDERCVELFMKPVAHYDINKWNDWFCTKKPIFGCTCRAVPDKT